MDSGAIGTSSESDISDVSFSNDMATTRDAGEANTPEREIVNKYSYDSEHGGHVMVYVDTILEESKPNGDGQGRNVYKWLTQTFQFGRTCQTCQVFEN